jgi:hypothetical protein
MNNRNINKKKLNGEKCKKYPFTRLVKYQLCLSSVKKMPRSGMKERKNEREKVISLRQNYPD